MMSIVSGLLTVSFGLIVRFCWYRCTFCHLQSHHDAVTSSWRHIMMTIVSNVMCLATSVFGFEFGVFFCFFLFFVFWGFCLQKCGSSTFADFVHHHHHHHHLPPPPPPTTTYHYLPTYHHYLPPPPLTTTTTTNNNLYKI